MSYDLAVWEGPAPKSNDEAGSTLDDLYERYLESEDAAVPPNPRVQAYIASLRERYPDDTDESPWATPSGMDEASGPIVYLLLSYSHADELSEYVSQLARAHGLVCFDIHDDSLRS